MWAGADAGDQRVDLILRGAGLFPTSGRLTNDQPGEGEAAPLKTRWFSSFFPEIVSNDQLAATEKQECVTACNRITNARSSPAAPRVCGCWDARSHANNDAGSLLWDLLGLCLLL